MIMLAEKVFRNECGQTLVEAIIAMAIILVALIGFVSQSTFNYTAGNETVRRNLALNLAREGVEVARSLRDGNWLKGCPDPDKTGCYKWNTGLAHNLYYRTVPIFYTDTMSWKLDFTPYSFDDCVSNKFCLLYRNKDDILTADFSVKEPSEFYRQLDLRPICASSADCGGDGICETGEACTSEQIGIEVVSRVRWLERGDARNVVLTDYLYNWK